MIKFLLGVGAGMFLFSQMADAKTYSDDDALKLEFDSYQGVSMFGDPGQKIKSHGMLWTPDETKYPGPRPAVVIVPGVGGQNGRDQRMCDMFIQNGITCLGLRIYDSRNVKKSLKWSQKFAQAGVGSRLEDAYNALHVLGKMPNVDQDNVWMVGMSVGGFVSAIALSTDVTEPYRIGDDHFAGFVNLYGGCPTYDGDWPQLGSPYMHYIGEADANWNERDCNAFYSKLKDSGVQVTHKLFKGSQFNKVGHLWDWMTDSQTGRGSGRYKLKKNGGTWGQLSIQQYGCGLAFDFDTNVVFANDQVKTQSSDTEIYAFVDQHCGVAKGTTRANHSVMKEVDAAVVEAIYAQGN